MTRLRTGSDTLSLTLPTASRSKARKRKWKKPPRAFWWWLTWALACGVMMTVRLSEGDLPWATVDASMTGLYWTWAMRARDGVRRVPSASTIIWPLANCAAVFALIAGGVK